MSQKISLRNGGKCQLLQDHKSWKRWIKLVQKGNLNFTAHDVSTWHMLLKEKPNEHAQNAWQWRHGMNYGYFLAYATILTLCHVAPDSNQVTAGKEQIFREACARWSQCCSKAQAFQAAGNAAHLLTEQGWKISYFPNFSSIGCLNHRHHCHKSCVGHTCTMSRWCYRRGLVKVNTASGGD